MVASVFYGFGYFLLLGDIQKVRSLKIPKFWRIFKKPQWNFYEVYTISTRRKCLLYGDVRFIESPTKNQKSSKLNMKLSICHDVRSPDLLEGPQVGKVKENAKFFFVIKTSRFTTLVHLTTDHEVHINYNQWISIHFCWKCTKKIMDSAEKRTKVKSAGKSDRTPFIDRSEYYNLSWWFV